MASEKHIVLCMRVEDSHVALVHNTIRCSRCDGLCFITDATLAVFRNLPEPREVLCNQCGAFSFAESDEPHFMPLAPEQLEELRQHFKATGLLAGDDARPNRRKEDHD